MPYQPPARLCTFILSLTAMWALGGCSEGGADYPSLASRPVERMNDSAQAAARATASQGSQAPGPVSADLVARLNQLVDQARSAHRDFADQQGPAEKAIAAAGSAPAGSEEWARATQALSGVEAARSLTAQPLTEIDRLDVDNRLQAAQMSTETSAGPRPDAAAIAQARETIAALVAEEDDVLAKLDGRLAR
jgi:hypothetical protein